MPDTLSLTILPSIDIRAQQGPIFLVGYGHQPHVSVQTAAEELTRLQQTSQASGHIVADMRLRVCLTVVLFLKDGVFMIAFASPRGAIEWALLLQLALLR